MRDSAITMQRAEQALPRSSKADAALPAITPAGPRKLIRPKLPAGMAARFAGRSAPVSASLHEARAVSAAGMESSHAEVFYFQKQIQSQTLMVVVLEQGEQIEGQIEWYDRDAIKIRHGGTRTLVYKTSIKYLYKAGESAPK